jgi:hypothetical protein
VTLSLLAVGFLMGLRHALEADHLAAVAALTASGAPRRQALRVVAAWGAGHGGVLVLAAGAMGLARRGLPERGEAGLEAAAGAVLLALGIDVLRRARRRRLRFQAHVHADGTRHLHAHDRARHDHVRHPLGRALAVGGVHGLAGSAVIGIVALDGVAAAVAYAALLGVGSALGMLLLTASVAVPLGRGRRLAAGRIEALAGIASVVVGAAWAGRALLSLAAG